MNKAKENKTVVGKIYETHDYDMFHFLEENRDIDPANVEKIKASIQIKRLINPLKVDSKGGIYDGQHNYTALKELGLPIWYVVDKNLTIEDIPRLNTIAKTWNQKEYLSYYCKRGFKEYAKIRKFMLDNNLSITLSLCFLAFTDNGSHNNDFKRGTFKAKNILESQRLAKYYNEVASINPKLGYKFARVLTSLSRRTDFDLAAFVQKAKIQPTRLLRCATDVQYRELIESIYNYKNRHKVNLRF